MLQRVSRSKRRQVTPVQIVQEVLSEEAQGKGPRLLNKPHTEGCAVACDDVSVAHAFAGVCGSA
jgi:hypothetical protein